MSHWLIQNLLIMFFVLLGEALFFAILYWWANRLYLKAHAPRDKKTGKPQKQTVAEKYGLE